MSELYPIIEVERESGGDSEEMMGSKDKFWYLHPTEEEEYWLFKYPRFNTGEHWAEKIAAEVADLLGISHARVELAIFEEDKGSVTKLFVQEGQELVHGNQMLKRAVHGYDPEKEFRQSSHTLANIWQVMDSIFGESEHAEKAKGRLAEYVVLDALIGNTDRHHENWGILRWERRGYHWVDLFVAPFVRRHASSLGRELQDTRRDVGGRILAIIREDRIGDYVEKGRGAIYWSEADDLTLLARP